MATSSVNFSNSLLQGIITNIVNDFSAIQRLKNRMDAITNTGGGPFLTFEAEFNLTSGTGSAVYTDLTNIFNQLKNCVAIAKFYDIAK